MDKSSIQEILKKLREKRLAQEAPAEPVIPEKLLGSSVIDRYGKLISLNSAQESFVNIAGREGKSAVLIGAAGTGKTTTQYAVCQELIQSGAAGIIKPEGHKHLVSGTPGIIIVAYTRRAVANIKRNLPKDLQSNAMTVHKFLEYEPVYDEVQDPATGEVKKKMSFQPARTEMNPVSSSVRTIIFEESSMLGTDLYKKVQDAMPHEHQEIFLGDIQQLPPVFGPAILGFKLLSLPVVELTEVYRQALESPIISLAHRILSGIPIQGKDFPEWKKPNQLTLHPWKKKIDSFNALNTAGVFFTQLYDHGQYDPEQDIILIPFNKSFGTIELNNKIANHLARMRGAVTHQIVAGFNKLHLSVGDKILFDKEDAIVKEIAPNPSYTGASYTPASTSLDYWGHDPKAGTSYAEEDEDEDDVDFLLAQVANATGEDRVNSASHIVTVQMQETEREVKLDKASEINSILLGYALTVHKSQGSEWRKVYFLLHQSHATMISRELLYTGVTRAKEELYIICEPDTFEKGILSQRVKGNTIEEKAAYFKGKLEEEGA